VFVAQMFPPERNGNASRVHDTARHIQGDDRAVTVLAPPPTFPPGAFDRSRKLHERDTVDGIEVRRLWTWQPLEEDPGTVQRMAYYLLFGIHAILWLVWQHRAYDVVVASVPPISTGAAGLAAGVLGTPWMVDVRDLWIDASISLGYLEAGSLVERVSRRYMRTVLHRADRIGVTTATLGDSISDRYGDDLGEKTVVLPNGVDTDRFRPRADGEREVASAAWSDGGEPDTDPEPRAGSSARATDVPTIVYTGNIGTAQDHEACLHALSRMDHEDAVLRLVGGGDTESRLRGLARDLDLTDRVTFDGVLPREAIPAVLDDATVGIAPLKDADALSYAMPTKVYEYLACGLPTLVTGPGEIERFVAESGGGVHADNDPDAIADRLDELLDDPELRRRLAERGRDHVVEQYDRGVIADRFDAELSALVAHGQGTRRAA